MQIYRRAAITAEEERKWTSFLDEDRRDDRKRKWPNLFQSPPKAERKLHSIELCAEFSISSLGDFEVVYLNEEKIKLQKRLFRRSDQETRNVERILKNFCSPTLRSLFLTGRKKEHKPNYDKSFPVLISSYELVRAELRYRLSERTDLPP